jgi:hypothetical protein
MKAGNMAWPSEEIKLIFVCLLALMVLADARLDHPVAVAKEPWRGLRQRDDQRHRHHRDRGAERRSLGVATRSHFAHLRGWFRRIVSPR